MPPSKILPIFLSLSLLIACQSESRRVPENVNKGVYFWKTEFKTSAAEKRFLVTHQISKIYCRFFDIDYNFQLRQAVPNAPIVFKEAAPRLSIVPVVFITNRVFEHLTPPQIDSLAGHLMSLVKGIAKQNKFAFSEIQLDCDWTLNTKNAYFRLLQKLKNPELKITATIRLHQIKYAEKTGIPPVSGGTLMLYNTGNWQKAETKNSLFDPATIFGYTQSLEKYPLRLDVALPIYQQILVYRNTLFYSFLKNQTLPSLLQTRAFGYSSEKKLLICHKNIFLDGISFRIGDVLRLENADFDALQTVKSKVFDKLQQKETTILLFHLDEKSISHYSPKQMARLINPN
jgi:hypothetical protein